MSSKQPLRFRGISVSKRYVQQTQRTDDIKPSLRTVTTIIIAYVCGRTVLSFCKNLLARPEGVAASPTQPRREIAMHFQTGMPD